ncbi:hypothetical protein HUW86_09290 [Fusobacterium sp. SB021]|uniref:hypothetical protein n=1 Tax=Fusobacterium sp. SB021 TaxID=2744227 RepID=UPI003CF8BCF4
MIVKYSPAIEKYLKKLVEIIDDEILIFILAGTRENFYDELKKYLKKTKGTL